MSEAETLFATLRQSTGDDAVAMLERMVRDAPDHALSKINALDLAAKEGIGEERVIAALLNAVGLGIFEMSWNVMCPSCAGVISANKSLKTLDRAQYHCAGKKNRRRPSAGTSERPYVSFPQRNPRYNTERQEGSRDPARYLGLGRGSRFG